MAANTKVYEIVTAQIIEQLEKGQIPWHKPWNSAEGMPRNLVSKRAYRGINVWLLAGRGYESPYWVSFKQCKDLGGTVKKGEESTLVVFWKFLDVPDTVEGQEPDENTPTRTIPLLRYYRVFNVEQCEGLEKHIPQPEKPKTFNALAEAEKIVEGYQNKPRITHGQAGAYYRPSADLVGMPHRTSFENPEEYYSTLFHELTHSTGHKDRLARFETDEVAAFGSETYSKEELIAEMGASYLSNEAGILQRTIENSAAYIRGWLKRLQDDKRLIVTAAAQAQKAVDHIRGQQPGSQEPETSTNQDPVVSEPAAVTVAVDPQPAPAVIPPVTEMVQTRFNL